MRENLPAALAAAVGILIIGWLGLTDWAFTDYDREAHDAFTALVHGHLLGFVQHVPAYGGSLVLRAPFVLATKLWDGGDLAVFRASAFPCLLATGVLGVWLAARLRKRGASPLARAVALMLCAANPISVLALESGHPEALLGGVLCVAAVLAAMSDRPLWAGALLGLAIANQEWALLAVGPVLIALPGRRVRALCAAGSIALVVLGPLLVVGGFAGQVKGAATTGDVIFSPWQFWWFLGSHLHRVIPSAPWATRLEPHWLSLAAHPMIVAAGLPLTLVCVYLRRRGAPRPEHEALLLLVFLFFLRCVLDPWDNWYYPLPFLFALVTWETLGSDRPPVISLAATVAVWAITKWAVAAHGFSADGQSLFFLVFAVPGFVALTLSLYAPRVKHRLLSGRTRGEPAVSPV